MLIAIVILLLGATQDATPVAAPHPGFDVAECGPDGLPILADAVIALLQNGPPKLPSIATRLAP